MLVRLRGSFQSQPVSYKFVQTVQVVAKHHKQFMAAPSLILFHTNNLSSPFPLSSPKRYINQTLNDSSFLNFKKQSLLPNLRAKNPRTKNPRSAPAVVFAAQSNFLKVVQTVWKVGKDGVEAGTNLVPDSVPRPIARVAVTVAVFAVSLFLLKSFLSTAFFALATMGLVYFTFIALNKDQGPKGGGGANLEDPEEEARRIMEKYK